MVLFNGDNGSPDWSGNPGWFAIQIYDGNNKVWGTAQATGAGY
jgi:hypothetical protein